MDVNGCSRQIFATVAGDVPIQARLHQSRVMAFIALRIERAGFEIDDSYRTVREPQYQIDFSGNPYFVAIFVGADDIVEFNLAAL